VESIKILTLGGITLDEALKTVKDIADRHEKQLRLLEVAADIERQRANNRRTAAQESGS